MTYAIFRSGGKQFRAEPGKTLRIPSLVGEAGTTVEFTDVLLGSADGSVKLGVPTLSGAKVVGEIVKHGLGDKIVVFKFKRRKNYARKQGRTTPASRGTGRATPKSASRTSPSADGERYNGTQEGRRLLQERPRLQSAVPRR
jgi:large subunit ribosomal protein L21